jgi:acyl-CoA synthetase (AMP-forming)/AMP-acid ligase II
MTEAQVPGATGQPGALRSAPPDLAVVPGPSWAQMYARHALSARPAVVSAAGTWSFRELTERAAGWAAWLEAAGLPPGRPVPVLSGGGPSAYALLLAGACTGRPLALLGSRLTPPEIARCLAALDTGGPDSSALVADAGHAALGREVAGLAQRRLIVLPDPDPDALRSGELPLDVPARDVAMVLFTSGTTGVPKAVALGQSRLGARTRVYAELLDLRPDDVYSSSQGFHHLAGAGLLMVALGLGAAVVPPAPRFTMDSWRALAELGTTHATVAPAMIERLLAAGALALPSLRMITYGASPIRPATLARLVSRHPSIQLLQGYSQTEGGPITALTPADHLRAAAGHARLLTSAGRPVRGTSVVIHDPGDDGIGEVWAQADHLAAPRADGWLHTGDMGRLDDDSFLYLSGRQGDMIIRGGENVYPEEVEQRLVTHPGVREAAVVGISHEVLGQEIVAFIVPAEPRHPPSEADLRAYVRAELAGFKVPAQWRLIDELPRGALGKVLRRELRADS